MKLLYKLFVFSLALLSTWSIKAEMIEVILHDDQIKFYLANQGLDLDTLWKDDLNKSDRLFYNSYRDGSDVDRKMKDMCQNNDAVLPKIPLFPETADEFNAILEAFSFTAYNENETNHTNAEHFNTLLAHKNNKFEHTIQQLTPNNLLKGIMMAIHSYCTQEAISKRKQINKQLTKQHIHLYIKFVIDTDEHIITLQTCPYAPQSDFIKTYTNQQVADLVTARVGSHKNACSKVYGCMKQFTIGTIVALIVLTAAGFFIDPETIENFIEA